MSWKDYLISTYERPLRPLYIMATHYFDSNLESAIDLGCGTGAETADMLGRGIAVTAVDMEYEALKLTKERTVNFSSKLTTILGCFEDLECFPPVDLIFAYHSLPFCTDSHLMPLIEKMNDALLPRGLFVATFFGIKDSWVKERKVAGISQNQLKKLFKSYELLHFKEDFFQGEAFRSEKKDWHIFEIIARKSLDFDI